ncbi:MAG: hypothetical protein ACRC6T_14410 [Sarcina sp.]
MKCIWCGKTLSEEEINLELKFGGRFDDLKCCSPECLTKINSFNKYAKKNTGWFLVLMLISIIGFVALNIIYMANTTNLIPFGSFTWLGIILGGTLMKFPFCTPQTNKGMGAKKAILIGKSLGLVLLIIGIIFGILTIIQFA